MLPPPEIVALAVPTSCKNHRKEGERTTIGTVVIVAGSYHILRPTRMQSGVTKRGAERAMGRFWRSKSRDSVTFTSFLTIASCMLANCSQLVDGSSSLPDPDSVNAFLLQHPDKLDAYLLTEDAPKLPLVKCTATRSPAFDFYQLAVKGGDCDNHRMRPKGESEYTPFQEVAMGLFMYFMPIWTSAVLLMSQTKTLSR